jgi:hypothetical protein
MIKAMTITIAITLEKSFDLSLIVSLLDKNIIESI